jgi:hypothetical protein
MNVIKATKGLSALKPELYCKQIAMGLPLGTATVFDIVKYFGKM